MKKIVLLMSVLMLGISVHASEVHNISADEAIAKLKEGNLRFSTQHLSHPDESKARRQEVLKGQHPFVVVLSCSDSRVPAELIFDQGIGDIFVIRNAGNVIDEHVIGSIEYAVYHLGVKLVVVLGHQDCGAVKATMQELKESKFITSLEKSIKPAIQNCKKKNKYTYVDVVQENAKYGAEKILDSDSELVEYAKKHEVKIVPAYYNLENGVVEFLQ